MAEFPYFPFYPSDWLSSLRNNCLTLEQQGGYMRLLCLCWTSGTCSLPDDQRKLQKLSGLPEHLFQDVYQMFIKHPQLSDALTSKRLWIEWERTVRISDQRSQAAKKPRKKRVSKCSAFAQQMPSGTTAIASISESESESELDSEIESKQEPPNPLAKGAPGSLKIETILMMWNATPGIKLAQSVTGPIRDRVKIRLREHPTQDWWTALFARVSRSDFLTGRKCDFVATLDWVLGPKNLAKIDAGNYDNPPALKIVPPQQKCEWKNSEEPCAEYALPHSRYCEAHKAIITKAQERMRA